MKYCKSLAVLQKKLVAPKGQYNSFGKYNYRNCEDILEAVKPLLGEAIITLTDDMVLIGDRYYVKATATYAEGEESVCAVAFAREPLQKKGMDESQITGAASSYARKYALNALLLIDDNKDADSDKPQAHTPTPVENKVQRIVELLKINCKGFSDDDKRQFLKTSLMVDNVSELYDKPIADLDSLIAALEFMK